MDQRHIGVAVGRNYGDVPPIRGIYRSGGGYSLMKMGFNVEPADPAEDSMQSQSQQ